MLNSFLLIGSPITTGEWDPNLLFVNWISNDNRLMESTPLFGNWISNVNRLVGS
jgi:hypothetical protein